MMINQNRLVAENQSYMELLTTDNDAFFDFLNSMSKFYRTYTLEQQLSLHLHAPRSAKAVATKELWKKYLGTDIIAEAAPIPILITAKGKISVITVYDVQDTVLYNKNLGNNSLFNNIPWSYEPDKHKSLIMPLFNAAGDKELALDEAIHRAINQQDIVQKSNNSALLAATAEYIIRMRLGLTNEKSQLINISRENVNLSATLTDANIIVNTLLAPVRAAINDYEKNKAKGNEVTKNEQEPSNKNDRERNIGVRLRSVGSNSKDTDAGEPDNSMETAAGGGNTASDAARLSEGGGLGGSTANSATDEELGRDGGTEAERRSPLDFRNGTNQNIGLRDDDGNRLTDIAPIDPSTLDFTADLSSTTGKRAVFQRNVAALNILNDLENENRQPTELEKKILASYEGWGGMPEVFDADNSHWHDEYTLLKGLLSENDYMAACASTLNAHFTPTDIIEGIYEGISKYGFKSGNVLDPSTGTGRFLQQLPAEIAAGSSLYGIELDATTAKIAKYLNPNAEIYHQGFETTAFSDNSFDMAISNVPFGDYQVEDKTRKGMLVHDYFLNKMVDQVRAGGLVIAITSSGTLDKKDHKARLELARKADLVRAIRLPNTAFSADGTNVVADILILKKRERERDASEAIKEEWVNTGIARYPYYNHTINSYFNNNQSDILGELAETTTAYGKALTVIPASEETRSLKEQIASSLQADNSAVDIYQPLETPLPAPRMEIDNSSTMPYGYYFENGKLIKITADGKAITPELNVKDMQQVTAAVQIRDNIRELFKAQQNDCSDEVLAQLQANLRNSYNAYTKVYGTVSKSRNFKKLFRDNDASYGLLMSLEIVNEETQEVTLSKIFTERTIKAYRTPTSADTPDDALSISLQEKGRVDLSYMSDLTGDTVQELLEQLEFTSIYEDIQHSTYVTADEYLSGDIRSKIEYTKDFIRHWQEKQTIIAKWDLFSAKYEVMDVVLSENDITDTEKQILPQNDFQRNFLEQEKYSRAGLITSDDIKELLKPENISLLAKTLNNASILFLKETLNSYQELIPKFDSDPDFYIKLMRSGVSDYLLQEFDHGTKLLLNLKRELEKITGEDYLSEADYALLRECVDAAPTQLEISDYTSLSNLILDKRQEQQERILDYIKNTDDELINRLQGEINKAAKNLAALEKVKPKDLTASDIKINLGATWIPIDYIQSFLHETFKTSYYENAKVEYCDATGEWHIADKKSLDDNIINTATYGVAGKSGVEILEAALNLKNATVYKTISIGGREKRILDKQQTMLAAQKQADIKKAFTEWIYADETRKNYLVNYYNRRFNSLVPRQFDGSKLAFPGMNPAIELRSHQKNAVARTLFGGNTLLAHVVGAGKTFEMQASAMEAKRIGLAKKSLMIMPKHLTEQFGAEFLRLYPDAQILVATKKDFEKSNRQRFIAKITNQDWDAVVMSYEQFQKIPLSPERQIKFINNEIAETMIFLQEQKAHATRSFTVKAAQKKYKQLKAKFDKLQEALNDKSDHVLCFEDLGIDRLYVDEAHNYKNLEFDTKIQGINNQHVEKTWDMLGKIRYLNEITGERGVVFASGTPVSNSLAELYTLQRYLRPSRLKEAGIAHFDAWAATFGESVTNMEISPDGRTFQPKTRFSKFQNIPELITMFKDFADVQTADMLKLAVPTHEIVVEKIESTPIQNELMNDLSNRADLIRRHNPRTITRKDGSDYEDIMLNITTDGRKLAMDARLLNEDIPDERAGKIDCCVNNVVKIYNDTMAKKSTQIIFSDIGTPAKDGRFTVYKDLHDKLVASGIKEDEIAIIHDYEDEKKKLALFDNVNKGNVRVLIGSSEKLGVGTNVQKKLIATHDLDCPWKPSQLEQRLGRIVRRGNENEHVKIYRYVTENSFDSYLWQTCENKQRFISQIMTSKSPIRVAEDVDETTLSYADIKAISTGNPLFKEKMKLEQDLEVLNSAKAQYLATHEKLANKINKTLPNQIQLKNSKLGSVEEDIDTVMADSVADKATFCGKIYKGAKEIGAMLAALAKEFRDNKTQSLIAKGTYRGLEISVIEDFTSHMANIKVGKSANYTFQIGSTTPEINAGRLMHTLEALNSQAEKCRQDITELNNQLEVDRAEYAKPFDKAEEYVSTEKRLAEVTLEIEANSDNTIKQEINNRLNTIVGINETEPSNAIESSYVKKASALLIGNSNKWSDDFDRQICNSLLKEYKQAKKTIVDTICKYSPSLPPKAAVENIMESFKDNSTVAVR